MKITCLTVGDLATNCYLVTDTNTRETIIIDPGDEGDFISTTILEHRLTPKAILLTHGHYDHCLAALELKLNFSIPICLHQDDLFLYKKAHLTAKHFSGIHIPQLPQPDHFLLDSETISFGESSLQVIHTPGHTPGSICLTNVIPTDLPAVAEVEGSYSIQQVIFTGDTLFANNVGSTDHSYSSRSDLKRSLSNLRSEISNLRSVLIYPGHEDFEVYAYKVFS